MADDTQLGYIIAGCILGVAGLILIVAIVYFCKKRKNSANSDNNENIKTKQTLYNTFSALEETISSSELSKIDKNEVVERELIGVGSFGRVYRGEWQGKIVAVKKLPLGSDKQAVIDFMKEIKFLQMLDNPYIVHFYGAITERSNLSIITEYMKLGSLHTILHKQEYTHKLNWKLLCSLANDSCKGMEYLHSKKIIHRDLKSHNFLIDDTWHAKICDFGLSRIIQSPGEPSKMSVCGTPSWAAPEILRNDHYTEKVDVYSFGIVLWEMATKRDPYPGMPPQEIVFAVGTQGLRPKTPDACPEPWLGLIAACLNENPKSRPTFIELIQELENFSQTASFY
eukprot:TRINITY_DN332_c0_g2_i3.p1 TRINITY_DN332_c0_g2~~TRINITY_DN332_c0_g2_i3.p1  ORF type:complete len:339 (+),score=159.46 TRINITY_DN332_c0_g2_i3:115-1131(+)